MLSTAERTELVDCCELVDVGGGFDIVEILTRPRRGGPAEGE
jgi:hypothetical protein